MSEDTADEAAPTIAEVTPTIKVVHLWASMASVIVAMFFAAGSVVWSVAVFRTEFVAGLADVRKDISVMRVEMGATSADARASRDWIMREQGAQEEAARNESRRERTTPRLIPRTID